MVTHSVPRRSESKSGFTLVELLVVIGIIAVLISILLPSLQSARRQANSVKCLSSLRQIGNGFMLYANAFKGAFPVAEHDTGNTRIPINVQRRWYDLIAPYVVGTNRLKGTVSDISIDTVRRNSVLWGCPEWRGSMGESLYSESNDAVRPGYGMSYYAGDYFQNTSTRSLYTDYAYITSGNGSLANPSGKGRGLYVKQNKWKHPGQSASDCGLVIDSMTHVVNIPGAFAYQYTSVQAGGWQPGPPGSDKSVYTNNGAAFYVDATRHGKLRGRVTLKMNPNADKVRGMNMLFLDGHAAPVSVREAWEAFTGKRVALP